MRAPRANTNPNWRKLNAVVVGFEGTSGCVSLSDGAAVQKTSMKDFLAGGKLAPGQLIAQVELPFPKELDERNGDRVVPHIEIPHLVASLIDPLVLRAQALQVQKH